MWKNDIRDFLVELNEVERIEEEEMLKGDGKVKGGGISLRNQEKGW